MDVNAPSENTMGNECRVMIHMMPYHIRQNINPEQLLTRPSSWHRRDGIQKLERLEAGE